MPEEIRLSDDLVLSKDHALFMPESSILAIADLHIGHEAALQAEAVAIPDFQLDIMLARLDRLLSRYSPDRLVINGDMKHEFARNRDQEWDGIGRIVEMVRDAGAEITIVRGNHDNYLMTILARLDVKVVESFSAGGAEFRHGHKSLSGLNDEQEMAGDSNIAPRAPGHEPLTGVLRIFGHEHPVVRIRDEIGAMITLPCFLYSVEHSFIILPAFSPLASGTNVISPPENWMVEGLRGLDMFGARIFTLSGESGRDLGRGQAAGTIMDFGTVGAVTSLDFQI